MLQSSHWFRRLQILQLVVWTLLLNCCNIIYDFLGSFKHFIFFLCILTLIMVFMSLSSVFVVSYFYDLCRFFISFSTQILLHLLTSIHSFECWTGLRKKVPSTSGYRSYTSIISLHKMHVICVFLCAASDDKTNILVSSLPCFPSSSICKKKRRIVKKVLLKYQARKQRKLLHEAEKSF